MQTMQSKCRKCKTTTTQEILEEKTTKNGLRCVIVKCSKCGNRGARLMGRKKEARILDKSKEVSA